MLPKVLIPQHFHAELEKPLRQLGIEAAVYDADGRILDDSSGTVALFRWWISREVGDQMIVDHPQLRWIHTGSAGVDHILTPVFLQRRLLLTNSAGVHAPSIAEWVVGAMLAMEKDLPALLEQQRHRVWEKVQRDEISSRTIVFLGAGEIARSVAARLKPFGPRQIAIRRSSAAAIEFDEVVPVSSIDSVLGVADWLIVTIPLTDATRGLLDETRLTKLREGARIVNVSRGEVIDESALISHLRHGRLGGAILDVFNEEPLPAEHPFWDMGNVFVLPHTTWRSPQVKQRQLDLFLANASSFIRGEPLRNLVDVNAGY